MPYEIASYPGIDVRFLPELDGAGSYLWRHYIPIVRTLFGRVHRIHEYCAGPGFIGFSLLAHGLCDSVSFSDVNPAAIEALRETVRANKLEDRVSVYLSDCLDGIPDSERWDLVVANPPHYRVGTEEAYKQNILGHDPEWRIHRRFYEKVARFLRPSGSTLLLENHDGNTEADWLPMIEGSGLDRVGSFMFHSDDANFPSGFAGLDRLYYFWTRRKAHDVCNPQLLWEHENPIEPVHLRVSDLTPDGIPRELVALARYRIELHNDTDQPIWFGLMNEGAFLYVWPFPFPTEVKPGETRVTGAFYLEAGEYPLVTIDPRYHHRDILWRYKEPFEKRILSRLKVVEGKKQAGRG